MSGVSKKLMGTTAAGGGFTAIEDVFSTYLYTGNDSTQTITNGIDLAGEGGLVWLKNRTTTGGNTVYDTERGASSGYISTNTTSAQSGSAASFAFNSDGFTAGSINNSSPYNYASWTFRKAPRFFDVVTYTGDGVAGRTVSHNLGTTVGSIFIKQTTGTNNWIVYHRGANGGVNPEQYNLYLNLTNAQEDFILFNDTAPTDTNFTVSNYAAVNGAGSTYVAYLFAHDPLGPSGDGSDGLIACGSYTVPSANDFNVTLGWEPQWVMVKKAQGTASSVTGWYILDNMRGGLDVDNVSTGNLLAESSISEAANVYQGAAYDLLQPLSDGFRVEASSGPSAVGTTGDTYIYIAIRRGPMRAPESGTEVFAVDDQSRVSDGVAPRYRGGFVADFLLWKEKTTATNWAAASRMTGEGVLATNTTAAEVTSSFYKWDFMNGVLNTTSTDPNKPAWLFRRAPEFFDVVAYTGDGVAGRTVSHNLGVAPELIIVKARIRNVGWIIYNAASGPTKTILLNTNGAEFASTIWNNTSPTESVFALSNSAFVNAASPDTYIAYLFATLAGISKVGSYTGNGSSQTIDCGFTSSARFIIIKRTDSTGDWYVWDTARGIVAANDPHLSLNTTAAEVTTDDSIDPASSGFIVNQVAATNINVSAASYIFYAVA